MTEAEKERAAVVAWLRTEALTAFAAEHIDRMFALDDAADAIERGLHLKSEGDQG